MVKFTLSKSVCEFAKLRSIRAMYVSMVYVTRGNVPTCQTHANFSFLRAKVPKMWQLFNLVYQRVKACQFFNFVCQKAFQFFNCFSKEYFNFWIFQLCSTFANFKNIWTILENLSGKTKNLNFDIGKILLGKTLST